MKRLFIAALLTTSFFTPVVAAELDFNSSVNKVTVYPSGATVMRLATGTVMQGDHVIIIDDLPGRILSNSVRVEGTSDQEMAIGSVDVRQINVSTGDNASDRRVLEQQIESLKDDIATQNQNIANANMQRSMLQRLASSAILPRKKGGTAVVISADELEALLTLTGDKLSALSAETEKSRIEIRKLSKEIANLQKKLAETAPRREIKSVVSINIRAEGEGNANFKVSYNVAEAGWSPAYDARLTLGTAGKNSKIEVVRRASVQQSTTEKWDNVELVLSTARPSGSTKAPSLAIYELNELRLDQRKLRRKVIGRTSGGASVPMSEAMADVAAAKPKKAVFSPVSVAFAGFLAEYSIPGMVSIPNAGTRKNVMIGTAEFDAQISAKSVPKLDPAAYLTAKFTIKGATPYLPGIVSLTRDGVYLGQGTLPLLNSGEEHSLGFGRDDFIKISRTTTTSKKGEAGFISTVNVEERNFVTKVENLHDFPIEVIIEDQLPYARHEDIDVEMLSYSTKPDQRNVDDRRGILAWNRVMKAGEKREIKFGYKVSWPKKMAITPVR